MPRCAVPANVCHVASVFVQQLLSKVASKCRLGLIDPVSRRPRNEASVLGDVSRSCDLLTLVLGAGILGGAGRAVEGSPLALGSDLDSIDITSNMMYS